MSAAVDVSRGRLLALAIAMSIAVHGAALIVFHRTPVPWSPQPEASMLSVQIVELAPSPIAKHSANEVPMSKLRPRREAAPVREPAPAVQSEPPVAAQEAAAPVAPVEGSPPAPDASRVAQVTREIREPQDAALLIRRYADVVSGYLDARKRYPPAALARGWHGVVTLDLEVLREGVLDSVEVLHSSGYPLLDSTAVSIARSAQPFPAFAASLPERIAIHVDVAFRIAN